MLNKNIDALRKLYGAALLKVDRMAQKFRIITVDELYFYQYTNYPNKPCSFGWQQTKASEHPVAYSK